MDPATLKEFKEMVRKDFAALALTRLTSSRQQRSRCHHPLQSPSTPPAVSVPRLQANNFICLRSRYPTSPRPLLMHHHQRPHHRPTRHHRLHLLHCPHPCWCQGPLSQDHLRTVIARLPEAARARPSSGVKVSKKNSLYNDTSNTSHAHIQLYSFFVL